MARADGEEMKSRVRDEYDSSASDYESRWREYVRASVEETIRRVPRLPGASVLDVGCGTGSLLAGLAAAQPELRITGVDLSLPMIAAAREQLPPQGFAAVADAESLPFRDGSFDLVVSSSSFHFWPRPLEALRECRRVLTPHGTLVMTDWCDDFLFCRLCDRLLRLRYGTSHRVYGSAECRSLLESAGFEVLRIDRYKISWLWGLMTAVAK